MSTTKRLFQRFDRLQQSHRTLAFIVAVIKKYGDDQTGNRAALLTYYGFLALFPLLLVLTTVTQIIAASHQNIQNDIVSAATSYFPVLGDQLSSHIHTLHKTGFALIVGILFTLYGARGVANAFRQGVTHIWGIPRSKQDSFPASTLKNLIIIIVGGVGFIAAAICTSFAANAGHGPLFRTVSLLINVFILFWLFTFLLKITLPKNVRLQETYLAAACASIGLVILQLIGGYLLTRQLKNLDALYSYFALALGLMFWIYLQAQVLFYALEIATVHNKKLWPRSISEPQQKHSDTQSQQA